MREDIMALFEELYHNKLDLQRLNYATVVLIPKKEETVRVSDLRPITLLNRSFKIVTKVLANRLAPVFDNIIDPAQSGFIKGRNIHDSVATAHEVILKSKIARTLRSLMTLPYGRVHWKPLEQKGLESLDIDVSIGFALVCALANHVYCSMVS